LPPHLRVDEPVATGLPGGLGSPATMTAMRVSRQVRAAGLLVFAAVSTAACGDPGASATMTSASAAARPPPTPSARHSPTPGATATIGPIEFRSDRYEYSLQLPAGWYVWGEAPGEWTPREIGYIGAGTDAFEEDYAGRGTEINFPGITYGLYVSAAEVTSDMTLDAWTNRLAESMFYGSSCQGDPERETSMVGGEPAQMLTYDRTDCTHDHHVFVVGVLHGGRGYDIFWLAKQGESDARRADFESMLETFKLLD
jgi:hypothetical protein